MMFLNVFKVLEVTSDHRVLKISSHYSGYLWRVVVIVRGHRWGASRVLVMVSVLIWSLVTWVWFTL